MVFASNDEAVDTRIVEDALAFIDAFYGSSNDDYTIDTDDDPLAESDLRETKSLGLCAALRNLHTKLVAVHSQTNTSQLVRIQYAEVDETSTIQPLFAECRRLWYDIMGIPPQFFVLTDTNVGNRLRRRIDEMIQFVMSDACERPLLPADQTSAAIEVCDQSLYYPHEGIAVRFRSGRYIPFKLSILAMAAWSVVIDAKYSVPGRSQTVPEEYTDEILTRFQDKSDGSEGISILRRAYLPDGSLLFAWTDVSVTSLDEIQRRVDYIRDADTHQFGWVRVGRVIDKASGQQRVYLESVSDVELRPLACTDADDDINRRRFKRLQALMAWDPENGSRNRQLIENRMLEATRRTS